VKTNFFIAMHSLLFCLKRSFLLNSRKCLQARALGGCQVAWQLRLKRRIAAVLSFALLSAVASPKHTTVDALALLSYLLFLFYSCDLIFELRIIFNKHQSRISKIQIGFLQSAAAPAAWQK